MVRSFSSDFTDLLEQESLDLTFCVKITRQDSAVHALTSADVDLTIDGTTYQANPGMTPTRFTHGESQTEALLSLALPYSAVTESDARAGHLQNADVEILLASISDPSVNSGVLFKGYVGNYTLSDEFCEIEVEPLIKLLDQTRGVVLSPVCRNELGDSVCGVNLATYTHSGTVSSVTSATEFRADVPGVSTDDYFSKGYLTWTGGDNNDLSMDIRQSTLVSGTTHDFVLALPMQLSIQAGDTFDAVAGCNKTITHCSGKFNNIQNRNAEDYMPGMDVLLAHP